MDLIANYFNFKREYLLSYCTFLMGNTFNDDLRDKYLERYINTFINAYYLGYLDTLDEKNVEKVNYKEITEELKGRRYELQYELSNNKVITTKEEFDCTNNLILDTYSYVLLAVSIDIKDYSSCQLTVDYEQIVRSVFEKNKKIISNDENLINGIIKLVRKNTKITREYLDTIAPDKFTLSYDNYRGETNKFITKMHFNIKMITNNYKKQVVDKVYNDRDVYKEKLKQKLNLLNGMLLNKILNREELDYYFLNLPIEYIDTKQDMEEFLEMLTNDFSKKHIVFIVEYRLVNNHKTIIKCLNENALALLIDMTHFKDVQAKLEELESNPLYNYILIDNVKSEDSKLVLNYEMEGKEIFQNKYEFTSKEV